MENSQGGQKLVLQLSEEVSREQFFFRFDYHFFNIFDIKRGASNSEMGYGKIAEYSIRLRSHSELQMRDAFN